MPRRSTIHRSWTGHRIGESHPRARLSNDDVRLIRALHAGPDGLGYGTIAKKFECSRSAVQKICTMRTRFDAC